MGTHIIPREVEGEGRILIIFSMKGFIGTLIGIGVGAIFFKIFELVGASIVGWVLLFICALIGFIIGQVKIPKSNAFDLFKKTGGDFVYEVILKRIEFEKNKKIYTYDCADSKKK